MRERVNVGHVERDLDLGMEVTGGGKGSGRRNIVRNL